MTERLEEIKKRLVLLHNAIDVDDETKNYIFEDLKVEWLIERTGELKKDRDALEIKIDKAYRDTHNYKQALERILDFYPGVPNADFIPVEMLFEIKGIAYKALEREG